MVTVTPGGQGAVAFNAYAASVTNLETFNTTGTGTTVYLSTLNTSAASIPATDGSASSLAYDGLIAVQTDPTQTGYYTRLNAALSTSNPGTEFQAAFQALFTNAGPQGGQALLADPDEVLTTAAIRVELSDAIKSIGNPNGLRISYTSGPDGLQVGGVVTEIQNETTGKVVDVVVHPYMPAGVAVIRSKSLPIPDSGVSETVQVANVQDLMMLEWPVIQMSYDLSSYQYGSLLHYAPAWSGAIVGIQ